MWLGAHPVGYGCQNDGVAVSHQDIDKKSAESGKSRVFRSTKAPQVHRLIGNPCHLPLQERLLNELLYSWTSFWNNRPGSLDVYNYSNNPQRFHVKPFSFQNQSLRRIPYACRWGSLPKVIIISCVLYAYLNTLGTRFLGYWCLRRGHSVVPCARDGTVTVP